MPRDNGALTHSFSRDTAIKFEPLFSSIVEHWSPKHKKAIRLLNERATEAYTDIL